MKKIFLASSSPRRKQLLKLCCEEFTAIPADIDETIHPENDLNEEIMALSERKADKILAEHPDGIVIGSDTIVVLDGEVMGKPHDIQDAEKMLRQLSGRTHQVITGIAILSAERKYLDVSVSRVTFDELSDSEIRTYVKSGEPMDKAGAYAVQGGAARFITHIEGDYYAIMGLPVHKVYEELKKKY